MLTVGTQVVVWKETRVVVRGELSKRPKDLVRVAVDQCSGNQRRVGQLLSKSLEGLHAVSRVTEAPSSVLAWTFLSGRVPWCMRGW